MLNVGDSRTTEVAARRFWNDTGIHVDVGQCYRFDAAGAWTDLFICCDANGYPTPWYSLLQRAGQSLRRLPQEDWFTLIGAVRSPEDCRYFKVGSEKEVRIPGTGQLSFFANDAPGFYWNNSGMLRVTCQRIG